MTAHTPGPWAVVFTNADTDDSLAAVTANAGRIQICEQARFNDEDRANFSLIATAPDLLSALQDALDEIQACSAWEDALNGEDQMLLDAVNNGLAAIAKATGTACEPFTVSDPEDR